MSVNKASGEQTTPPTKRPGTDLTGGRRFAEAVRRAEAVRGSDTTPGGEAVGAHGEKQGDAAPKLGRPADNDPNVKPRQGRTEERHEGDAGRIGVGLLPNAPGPSGAMADGLLSSPSVQVATPNAASSDARAASPAGQAAADALLPKLSPRLPASFTLNFPPNAWPLLRAEGSRGLNGLTLRIAGDPKDEARLKAAVSSLRDALEDAGHRVESIIVLTDGK